MEIKITLANDQYTAIVNAEVVKATKWDDPMFNFIMKNADAQIVYDENDAKITALKKRVDRKLAKASAPKAEAPIENLITPAEEHLFNSSKASKWVEEEPVVEVKAEPVEVETCSHSCKQSGKEIIDTYTTEDGSVITIIH